MPHGIFLGSHSWEETTVGVADTGHNLFHAQHPGTEFLSPVGQIECFDHPGSLNVGTSLLHTAPKIKTVDTCSDVLSFLDSMLRKFFIADHKPKVHGMDHPTSFSISDMYPASLRRLGLPSVLDIFKAQISASPRPEKMLGSGYAPLYRPKIPQETLQATADQLSNEYEEMAARNREAVLTKAFPSDCKPCPQGRDYDADCPRGWTARESVDRKPLVSCLPPQTYHGLCNKEQQISHLDNIERDEFAANCDVCWPCRGESPAVPTKVAQKPITGPSLRKFLGTFSGNGPLRAN